MSRLLVELYILLALLGGDEMAGYAPRYAPGVMERVSRVRDLPAVECMVSSPYYSIGTWVWVWGRNTNALERCRVTDVSAAKDRERHIRTKRVVELGYEEALRFCGEEHMQHRPEQCPVIVLRIEGL